MVPVLYDLRESKFVDIECPIQKDSGDITSWNQILDTQMDDQFVCLVLETPVGIELQLELECIECE